jgi:hypothetical protein
MGKVTLPTKPEDLSREGLLWLIHRVAFFQPADLHHARFEELSLVAAAASEAWRASLPAAEQARVQYELLLAQPKAGTKALRAARDASELAEAKQERLWRASRRANAALDAYWNAMNQAREDA